MLSGKSCPIGVSEQGASPCPGEDIQIFFLCTNRTHSLRCLTYYEGHTFAKGSVFEAFIPTLIYWGNAGDGINLISDDVRCSLGLNLVLHVNSLILRKPKKSRVNAAQIIYYLSVIWVKASRTSPSDVLLWGVGLSQKPPCTCLIPCKTYCK